VRIDLVEKLVLVLAALAILAVGALVGVFSVLPPQSGIPDVAVKAALDTQDWLQALRARNGRVAANVPGRLAVEATPLDQPVASSPPPKDGGPAPAAPTTLSQAATTTAYFEASGNVPVADQVPGFPWLRRQPGVAYAQPQPVPDVLYRKYQSFEDTWNLVQEGGGEFVSTNAGATAYQVNWIDQNSYLATRIGLKPGDKVISVNGQPVGTSLAAGQGMFEQLKGEHRFAVMIERDGRPLVLSFFVNN
jgi:hypothetical protein